MDKFETKEQIQGLSESVTKNNISVKTPNEPETQIEEKEARRRRLIREVLTGKSPIRVVEKEGEVDWKNPAIKEPCNSLTDVFKKLTATTDYDISIEIFERGMNAMPNKNRVSRNANATLQSLADSDPKDATEARLIMQQTALYAQGMEYLHRSEISDMLYHTEFYMKYAVKLLRLHNETIEALSKYRRGGEQRVVVQHVQVNDGGKAIVGNVLN